MEPGDLECEETAEGVVFAVKASPGARADAVGGLHDRALRVRVTASPERGKANRAILALLAERLGVPRSSLALVGGETRPRKTIRVRGKSCAWLLVKLSEIR
ncbi:MAG: DUF167 domain-containing protein [Planctomycetota bacterium]